MDLPLQPVWEDLETLEADLVADKKKLEGIWVNVARVAAENEQQQQALNSDPLFQFVDPDTHIVLNVGGQVFETRADVLTRDPFSILAGLCRPQPVLSADSAGAFFFDRDWWIFRHILLFLQADTLPRDMDVLEELYLEASFYRLTSLTTAIESIPVHKLSRRGLPGSSLPEATNATKSTLGETWRFASLPRAQQAGTDAMSSANAVSLYRSEAAPKTHRGDFSSRRHFKSIIDRGHVTHKEGSRDENLQREDVTY